MRESRKPPSFKRAKPEDSNESSGFLRVVGSRALVLFVWYLALCLLQGVCPYACCKMYGLVLIGRCKVLLVVRCSDCNLCLLVEFVYQEKSGKKHRDVAFS